MARLDRFYVRFATGLGMALLTLSACAYLRTLSPDHEAANAPKTHSEAGRDSTILNVNFQSIADKAGWGATVVAAIVAVAGRHRAIKAVDTCVLGMEQENCDVCQRHVEAMNNSLVNKRVKVVKDKCKRG